jgi:single-stranded-DNA-specific exonuclease
MNWFKENEVQEPNLISFLDITALGTVCDVVPLKGVNRLLVIKGIEVMRKQLNLGIRSLIEKSSIKGKISTYDLGFKLGPRINAAGRLGRSSFGTELLTAKDRSTADEIANQLDKFNLERRTIESHVLLSRLNLSS